MPAILTTRPTLRAAAIAAACLFGAGAASAATITFGGFGGVNEDGTPDNGAMFSSYSEAGFTLTPSGASFLVAKAVGNAIPAIYSPSDGTSAFGQFDVVRSGGGLFTFGAFDLAAINSAVSYAITGTLAGVTAYSFNGMVAGRPFMFGMPVVFDSVMNSSFAALTIDKLTVALTGGGTSFTVDNIGVTNAVPEPASLALMALGLAGVLAARRRRG